MAFFARGLFGLKPFATSALPAPPRDAETKLLAPDATVEALEAVARPALPPPLDAAPPRFAGRVSSLPGRAGGLRRDVDAPRAD